MPGSATPPNPDELEQALGYAFRDRALLNRALTHSSSANELPCCPWGRCPNIGPAYKQLRGLGFIHVKALYLANDFGDDWVSKGYPVERGE